MRTIRDRTIENYEGAQKRDQNQLENTVITIYGEVELSPPGKEVPELKATLPTDGDTHRRHSSLRIPDDPNQKRLGRMGMESQDRVLS